jgi:tetratricopeptide (TPR) repeat protein
MKFLFASCLFAVAPLGQPQVHTLYNTIDPKSVAEALAFYELYPEADQGKKALARAATLLQAPEECIIALISQINRFHDSGKEPKEEEILLIENMASHLPNRMLKGYHVKSEEEIIALPTEEIDLGKALILSQMDGKESAEIQARAYSALLDLMALQILARLSKDASNLEKIQEMNRFIFDQMHFKFPPHSVYTENIDLYTFLPSVMDNHLGVCLGVTALYLAIAQRINLPLEIITPPGHIFVRCKMGENMVNVETTARGIHMPDETYLSVQNAILEQRTLKEVVGMTHVNQASTYLYKGEYPKAVRAYEKAQPYMPEDPLVKELLGYSYLFTEKREKGESLLKELVKGTHAIAEDYLAGKVGLEGIEAAFMQVDENHESIIVKQKRLKHVLEKYPEFRDGLLQLAITWIQLNHAKEAIDALTRCHTLDSSDAVTAYYLAVLHGQRQDFNNSWRYLREGEKICAEKDFFPKALKELRRELIKLCPEPPSKA